MRGDHSVLLLLVSGCGPQRPGGGGGWASMGSPPSIWQVGGGRWGAEGLRPSVWGEGASAARWQGSRGLT